MKQPLHNSKDTIYTGIYWLLSLVGWFIFLHGFSQYHFYYLEQTQLFIPDTKILLEPEGIAAFLTGSYVQHFGIPFVGPLLLAIFNTLTAWGASRLLDKICPDSNWRILSQLIPISLTCLFFNHLYRMEGTTTYCLVLLLLVIHQSIRNEWLRLFTAYIFLPFISFGMGPIATFWAMTIILLEFLRKSGIRIYSLFLLPATGLFAWLMYYKGWSESLDFALFPSAYFHHQMKAPALLYVPWLLLEGLLILAVTGGKRLQKLPSRLSYGSNLLSLLLVVLAWWQGTQRFGNAHTTLLKEVTYFAAQENWPRVLELTKDNRSNYLYIAYRNLALSKAGRLADDLFLYPQVGALGLIPNWEKSFTMSQLLSDIYFHVGDIALSQQMAFEGNVAQGNGGSPHLWKRLVQTNLLFDYPEVAEKYISHLAKTPHYASWARMQQQFVDQPALIRADSLLGNKLHSLGDEKYLSRMYGIAPDFEHIAQNNPKNRAAIEYLGCLFLLEKDLNGFQNILDCYYGTDVLPYLPGSFQQAVIILNENNPDKWKQYHLSESLIRQFSAYKNTFQKNRQSPYLKETLYRNFGNTYWYYFTFKK